MARQIISRIPNKMRDRVPNPENVRVRVGIPALLLNEFLTIPADKRNGAVLPNICEQYTEHRACLYNRIKMLFKYAKIVTVKPGSKDAQHPKGIVVRGFHSLRHTFVSLSAEAGAPQHVIQQIVGHSSPLMTAHYLHLGNADLTRSAALIPALPMLGTQPEVRDGNADIIDVTPVEEGEEERAEMRNLADTLPLDQIREILNHYKRA